MKTYFPSVLILSFYLMSKFILFLFFLILEMAQLGNYDSGTAETPETDESLSVSIFPE